MKRGILITTILLSLVLVLSLGVVSAVPEITSLTADKNIGLVPLTIALTATTTGTIDTYSWNIGNGTIINTTTNTLIVNYVVANTNGVYTVSLTVNDTDGAVSTAATLDILARPDCPAGDGTCLFVPQDRCAQDKGISCVDEVAIRYCEEQGYVGYGSGSMTCDAGGNYLGSSVLFREDGSEVCGGADVTWILSLRCLSVGTCTENDTSTDLAEQFVFGQASEEGVDWLDSCIVGTTDKLNESYCDDNNQLAWKEVTCSEGCSGGVCKTPGLYCDADTTLALPQVAPESRHRSNDDSDGDGENDLYYCGLDEIWHLAKPTIDDISCVAAGTCSVESKCLASYECISNSCVDEYCISVTGELQEQRGILMRIWCFLTNMRDFFDLKTEYCVCVMGDDDAYWDTSKEECTV